ncbi:MAG: 2-C-methyl-D-erythritol 4-phosphate cytidylyltransferase [Actinomycetota bacterium]|nr:2-C-methyl-D-erythritol 4-phosphate cytidylyltransferase [Actinomycetota bacterium]
MKVWAVVPAAGTGERLGGGMPKAQRMLAGRPIIDWCVSALMQGVQGIVVAGPTEITECFATPVTRVDGGETRQQSVSNALGAIPTDTTHVLVHDAARPLVSAALIQLVIATLKEYDAVVPALRVNDTIKRVHEDVIQDTLPRNDLWRAQTPQGFRLSLLREAHARAADDAFEATDDAALVERLGLHPVVVPGEQTNIKITTAEDLDLAETIVRARA